MKSYSNSGFLGNAYARAHIKYVNRKEEILSRIRSNILIILFPDKMYSNQII